MRQEPSIHTRTITEIEGSNYTATVEDDVNGDGEWVIKIFADTGGEATVEVQVGSLNTNSDNDDELISICEDLGRQAVAIAGYANHISEQSRKDDAQTKLELLDGSTIKLTGSTKERIVGNELRVLHTEQDADAYFGEGSPMADEAKRRMRGATGSLHVFALEPPAVTPQQRGLQGMAAIDQAAAELARCGVAKDSTEAKAAILQAFAGPGGYAQEAVQALELFSEVRVGSMLGNTHEAAKVRAKTELGKMRAAMSGAPIPFVAAPEVEIVPIPTAEAFIEALCADSAFRVKWGSLGPGIVGSLKVDMLEFLKRHRAESAEAAEVLDGK